MNLQKKCLKCGEFFPAELMEFKFYCEKERCQKSSFYQITRIKGSRHITASFFDIYDLDRPIVHKIVNKVDHNVVDKVIGYERVCRVCGKTLLKKDGTYSYHKRYCNEHNGYELWTKYNWQEVKKHYARKVSRKKENKPFISQQFIEFIQLKQVYYKERPQRIKINLRNLIICEKCKKLCSIYYWNNNPLKLKGIHIHHKIPVHTLDKDNLHLIWDESNLIALCEDCHHKQDHQLKSRVDPFIHFKKITEFLEEV